MEMGEELTVESGGGAQVIKCGTVGERATEGPGHSAQPQRVTV